MDKKREYKFQASQIILSILILLFLGGGCRPRVVKIFTDGSVQEEPFTATVPFQSKAGIMIIEATINGVKGEFLFDTGAPNVVSRELAEKLGLKTLTKGRVTDSGGNRTSDNPHVSLNEVEIGGVKFQNIGAVVLELSGSDVFRCLDFDGIIGANLMRRAYWKIDSENQTISLSSDLETLKRDSTYKVIPFGMKFTGTPVIDIVLNQVELKNMVFDTGSNGDMKFPGVYLEKLKEGKDVSVVRSYGAATYGVGGMAPQDTTFHALIDSIRMGNLLLEKKVVNFQMNEDADIIGMEFLKNFEILLDWNRKEILMKPIHDYEYTRVETFGLGVNLADGEVLVGLLYNGSPAEQNLKIGDRILRANEYDFREQWSDVICDALIRRAFVQDDKDEIELVIDREGQEMTVILSKAVLLE
jgi:predicted aspartyl protease